MGMPERYAREVPDVIKIWEPEGCFRTQTKIWIAQAEARSELYGIPPIEQLDQIRNALSLSPEDIGYLTQAEGHETNKLLRLVQSKLPAEVGNVIHRGNTSSDVLDTSLALQIKASLIIVKTDFTNLKDSLLSLALKHKGDLQIGRSHGQHAVPQTFDRQVLGWYGQIVRSIERIKQSKKVIAFGKCSGEIGTNVFIDPELEKKSLAKLGLKPEPAPTQIIPRDRHAEVSVLMAVNGACLANIAMNLRLLAMTDVGEVREPFDPNTQQGSSAMPHKRNPELAERICGLDRIITASAFAELDTVKVWLERDISHSSTERFVFPDLFGSLTYAARLTKEIIDGLVVNSDRMLENLNKTYGAIYSPRLFNALLENGEMSRTQAYELVKSMAQKAMDKKIPLWKLAAKNKSITKTLSRQELASLFNPDYYLRNIDTAYKRLGIVFDSKK